MKLIGTVSSGRNATGLYTLMMHNLSIPLSGISDAHAGTRVCVVGKPRWSTEKGSYFKVSKCWRTNKPDKNSVEVEGTIVDIYSERKNKRNRRSACVLLASYEKPVPVADIWKVVSRINYGTDTKNGNGNFQSFSIKEQNPVNPNDWVLVSTSIQNLDDYMSRKAYLSWKIDESTGLYTMEVSLVK